MLEFRDKLEYVQNKGYINSPLIKLIKLAIDLQYDILNANKLNHELMVNDIILNANKLDKGDKITCK